MNWWTMWPAPAQISLLRYLVVWRVNAGLVQVPSCLSAELSRVLGTLIAERLPTQQAKPWRKALAAWGTLSSAGPEQPPADAQVPPQPPVPTRSPRPRQKGDVPGPKKPSGHRRGAEQQASGPTLPPSAYPAWPIEAVLWPFPSKRAFGQGEPILWELKLLGDAADHGLFLEVILPAMEAAASTTDERFHRPRTLWGRFDVHAIYAARGTRWEPFVTDGRLDLAYRPLPSQWAEGLSFEPGLDWRRTRLHWHTPFDLRPPAAQAGPSLELTGLLDALMARVGKLILGKWATAEQAWAQLPAEERATLLDAAAQTRLKRQALEPPPKNWPGLWVGVQSFNRIPPQLAPYLELASVLHIGNHTHFGCGTFAIE